METQTRLDPDIYDALQKEQLTTKELAQKISAPEDRVTMRVAKLVELRKVVPRRTEKGRPI
jgi:hypothetical protein